MAFFGRKPTLDEAIAAVVTELRSGTLPPEVLAELRRPSLHAVGDVAHPVFHARGPITEGVDLLLDRFSGSVHDRFVRHLLGVDVRAIELLVRDLDQTRDEILALAE